MSDADGKVVDIRSATPSARLKTLDWSDKRAQCKHTHVEIWAKEPIIECAVCGAVVDPYQWLRMTIGHWREMKARIDFEVNEAKAEMADLKRAIRLLRREYMDEAEKRQAERALMILPPRKRVNIRQEQSS